MRGGTQQGGRVTDDFAGTPASPEPAPQEPPSPDPKLKPIKDAAHGAIDYGFTAVNLAAPSLLGLQGPAASIPRAFALMQGGLNAVTRQPYAVKPLLRLRTHGWIELATIPMVGLISARSGALDTPRGRAFFGAVGAALATVYSLTDWNDPAGN